LSVFVAQLITKFLPVVGGAEINVMNLSMGLTRSGVASEVHTFPVDENWTCQEWPKGETVNGVRIFRWPATLVSSSAPLPISLLMQVQRVNVFTHSGKKLDHYDILHFHNEDDLSFPFFLRHTLRDTPRVFTSRTLEHRYPWIRYNPFLTSIFRGMADVYTVPTRAQMRMLQGLGIPSEKIRKIPNSLIDLDLVDSFLRHDRRDRDEDEILFVGRLEPNKGVMTLLKAIAVLRKSHPELRCLIAGGCSDQRFMRRLSRFVEKQSLSRNVLFLGSIPQGPALFQLYRRASVFVCPSHKEVFPRVVIEAMSFSLPVVASRTGGIPEQIGDAGVLVPRGDYKSLADALSGLMDDKLKRTKLGKMGRQRVEKLYSWKAVVQQHVSLYSDICSGSFT